MDQPRPRRRLIALTLAGPLLAALATLVGTLRRIAPQADRPAAA